MRTFFKINKCDRQHVGNWLRMFLIDAHRTRQIPSSQLPNKMYLVQGLHRIESIEAVRNFYGIEYKKL